MHFYVSEVILTLHNKLLKSYYLIKENILSFLYYIYFSSINNQDYTIFYCVYVPLEDKSNSKRTYQLQLTNQDPT